MSEQAPLEALPEDPSPVTQAVLQQQLSALTASFANALEAISENFRTQRVQIEAPSQVLEEQKRQTLGLAWFLEELTKNGERGHREMLE